MKNTLVFVLIALIAIWILYAAILTAIITSDDCWPLPEVSEPYPPPFPASGPVYKPYPYPQPAIPVEAMP
jgi:hypothetical protein